MMNKWMRWLGAGLLAAALVGCGGSGDAGDPIFGGGEGSAGGGGGGTTSSALEVDVQRNGTSTSSLSSTESVQAVAKVKDSSGSPIAGVVVTFTESGSGLLRFTPASGTALTDQDGVARVEVSASSAGSIGATQVAASAEVSGESISGAKSIQISAGSSIDGEPVLPAAMTFVGSVPTGTAIVVKGSGGSGRSESAVLTFKVMAADGAPVKDAEVRFQMNANNGGASFLPGVGRTNSEGLVTATVSSGTEPASIVMTATSVAVPSVSTQSDSLIVSNSVAIAAGFEIVAEKYNLDGRFTGDSTKVSAFVRDAFGNPVPDGLAVSFGTDYGAVASSTLGGCLTVNGRCSVDFRVQDPRGDGLATVIGQVRVGDTQVLAQSLTINMAAATGTPYIAVTKSGNTGLDLGSMVCKRTFDLWLSDGRGYAPAAGTTITVASSSSGVTSSVKSGSPVADSLDLSPVWFTLEVAVAADAGMVDPCDSAGATSSQSNNFVLLQFKTPNGILFQQRFDLRYPIKTP